MTSARSQIGRRSLFLGGAAAAVAAAMAVPTSALAATQAPTSGTASMLTNVTLRSSASATSSAVGMVGKGEVVTILGASGDWRQVSYQGMKGWCHGAYIATAANTTSDAGSKVVGIISGIASAPTYSSPSPMVSPNGTLPRNSVVDLTGTSSGSFVQATKDGRTFWVFSPYVARKVVPVTLHNQSFTAAGMTSTYHVYADNIDWSRPVGVLWYFDGDYFRTSYTIVKDLEGELRRIANAAAARNQVLIAPVTPSPYESGYGFTWWRQFANNSGWFLPLYRSVHSRWGVLNQSRTWLMGYSGGAEFIGKELMAHNQDWIVDGGALIVAGGGGGSLPSRYVDPADKGLKTRFRSIWVAGELDRAGETNPPTWSAYDATKEGQAYYAGRGWTKTKFESIPGVGHHSYNFPDLITRHLGDAGVR